jgi:hypothetical protein
VYDSNFCDCNATCSMRFQVMDAFLRMVELNLGHFRELSSMHPGHSSVFLNGSLLGSNTCGYQRCTLYCRL